MLSSSRIVQSFVVEYGEKGYAKLAASFKTLRDYSNQIAKSQKAIMALSNLRGTMGRDSWKQYGGPDAMKEQLRILKELVAVRKQYEELVKKSAANLQFAQELEAATPEGRVMAQWLKLGQVFRRVADALVSFVVIRTVQRMFMGFFQTIIGANAQIQTLETRLEAVTKGSGGSFQELADHIVTLTVKTPFMIRDFADAAITIKAFGLNAKQALGPIADWATAIGKDLPDVAVAFAKIAQGSPRTALLLTTRGISKKEFDEELARTKDRTQALTNIIDRQFGGMAFKVSRTFEGMISNIKDAWFLLAKTIGVPLFESLNRDVEKLYYMLLSANKETNKSSAAFKIFGGSLDLVYGSVKTLLPLLGILGLYGVLKKLSVGIQGLMSIGSKASVSIGPVIGSLLVLVTALAKVIDYQVAVAAATAKYNDALDAMNEQLALGNIHGAKYVDSLRAQLEAVNDLQGLTMEKYDYAAWAFAGWFELFPKLKEFYHDVIRFNDEEAIARERKLQKLRDEYNTSKQIYEIQRAIRDLTREELSPKETSEAYDVMLEKFGGVDAARSIAKRLSEEISKYPSHFFNEALKAQNISESYEEFTRFTNLRGALAGVQQILSFQPAKGRVDAVTKFKNEIQKLVDYLGRAGRFDVAVFTDLLSGLVDKEKEAAKAAKEYRDLTDEIAQYKARLSDLENGEATLAAKISGFKAANLEVERQMAEVKKQNLAPEEKAYKISVLYLQGLKNKVGALEASNALHKGIADSELRLLEASRGVVDVQAKLISSNLEKQYELTGDLANSYEAIDIALVHARGEHERIGNEIALAKGFAEKYANDIEKSNGYMAKSAELRKEQLGVEQQISDLELKRRNLPSTTLGEAFGKSIIEMKRSLNEFYDDLAKTVITGISTTASGILSQLLFGNDDGAEENLVSLRTQLSQMYAEAAMYSNSLNQIRRREGETNEAYLLRVQALEEIQAAQIQTFMYKTKEMELMEQINKAERERNNLITERLKALASSISDKILGSLVDRLVSTAFSFGGSGGSKKPPMTYGVPPPGAEGRGGMTIVVSGNNVYGQDDFSRMVDNAVKDISYRRGR